VQAELPQGITLIRSEPGEVTVYVRINTKAETP
jgi:hypothetical protein